MTKVILNSGGMDSFFVALEVPHAEHVFVDIGQKYVEKELRAARKLAYYVGAKLHEVKGAQIGQYEHERGIIPLRNAELILCAGQFGEDIYLGILENEVNSDKSPEFLRAMEKVMNISCRAQYWSNGRTFAIHTPLGTRSKVELAMGIRNMPSAWAHMLATVSCYAAGDRHCGECPSCFKRWVALTVASGEDYAPMFVKHPGKWKPLAHWQAQGYADKRIGEIEQAYAIAGL